MAGKYTTLALVSMLSVLLLGASAAAADRLGLDGAAVRYTYVFDTNVILDRQETMTTTLTPLPDGRYEVVTTVSTTSSPDEANLSFFGAALSWLGLSMASESGLGFVDVSALVALAAGDNGLEPYTNYILPQGSGFVTRGEVTVAGVVGIEGSYVPSQATDAVITVVLPKDPWLRAFLPFPLTVQVEYPEGTGTTGTGALVGEAFYSGRIILTEYVITRRPQ